MSAWCDREGLPDWRDPEAYRFERLDRAGFAWEWQRRDPGYRAVARKVLGSVAEDDAADWGLVTFVPPELAVPDARPLWSAAVDHEVLVADGAPCARHAPDAFIAEAFGALATCSARGETGHWLLTDGWRRVRLDVCSAAPDQPLELRWRLHGLAGLTPQLLALRRLLSVRRSGSFPNRLWPPDPRAVRWALALRAHDALAAGATQRDIAGLIADRISAPRWRIREPSLRLRAQRLAAAAMAWRGKAFAKRFLGSAAHKT